MDASTQTENISATSRMLEMFFIIFLEEQKKEDRIQEQLNIESALELDELYEDDIYDSYFYEDRVDRMADDYTHNFNTHNKYNVSIYYSIDDFHRGKSSNAKKSKRSISCVIPDGHDAWEEQNGYWNVSFHKGKLIYD